MTKPLKFKLMTPGGLKPTILDPARLEIPGPRGEGFSSSSSPPPRRASPHFSSISSTTADKSELRSESQLELLNPKSSQVLPSRS